MMQHIGYKTVMTSVAAISAATTAAQADSDWTGLYAGLSLNSFSGDVAGGVDTYFDPQADLKRSAEVGGFIGFNADIGGLVAGAEIARNGSMSVGGNSDYEANSMTDVKLKLGKPFGSTLVYGIAGMSKMGTSYNGCDDCIADGSGMAFGVGVEHKFNDRFSVGLEYLNRNLDTEYTGSSHISSIALRGVIHF